MNFFLRLQSLAFVCALFISPLQSQEVDRTVLPPEPPAFGGKVGTTYKDSTPDFSPALPLTAPKGAPNVLVIVLDDVGFGQLSCYGGPIETPNIDRLADSGLRYTNFHTTALCSPSRAALLTGRNHHSIGLAAITEAATGFPSNFGSIPKSAATISEVLKQNGYNTLAFGKWHLAPYTAYTAAGPFDRWPLGMGFERYYGFLGGETDQWSPLLIRDNHMIEEEREAGYHVTADLVDQAISHIQDQQQATLAGHSLPTWRWAQPTRLCMPPKSTSKSTAGDSTRGGIRCGAKPSNVRKGWEFSLPTPSCLRPILAFVPGTN